MPDSFVYQSQPIRVRFGRGSLEAVPAELVLHERARAVILCTNSGLDTASRIRSLAQNRIVDLVVLEPTGDARERLARIVNRAKLVKADSLVVIGGGTPIGFAKTIAAREGLRSVAVVTTYSGSEMASSWSIGAGPDRMQGDSEQSLPLTAVYDPDLTITLHPRTSAASGMNAMAHAVESLYGPDVNPIVELHASSAVALLGGNLPRVVDRPGDIDARVDALYGAWLAGAFRAQSGVEHVLAQRVRQGFGLDHAHCHAVFTPYAVAFNAQAAPRAADLIARALQVKDAGRGLFDLNVRLGLPTGLKQLGMREADLGKAIEQVAAARIVNPRPVSAADVKNLIMQAFHGEPPKF